MPEQIWERFLEEKPQGSKARGDGDGGNPRVHRTHVQNGARKAVLGLEPRL